MTEPSIDIDRVVREVLIQLGLAPKADPAPPQPDVAKTAAVPPVPVASQARPVEQSLVVSARVVTMDHLEGGLDRIRRVVVPPNAVVTPAVRDELRNRSVALVYEQPRTSPATGTARLVLVTLGKSFDPSSLFSALRGEGIDVEARGSDCLMAASDELARELADGNTLGVMLTPQPAIGLCLANRLRPVRAVLGTDAPETAAAATSVGANVLVVAPRRKTLFQLKHLIGQFCRTGVQPCPELLKERLA